MTQSPRPKATAEADPDFEISTDSADASTTSSEASLVDSDEDEQVVDVVHDDDLIEDDVPMTQKRKNPFAASIGGAPGAKKKLSQQTASQNSRQQSRQNSQQHPAPKDIEDVVFSAAELPVMQKALLDWYDENHRVLPWRRNLYSKLSPETVASQQYQAPPSDLEDDVFIYYVWICEIMSQQTQVSRVCEYFTKWVKKWPTVKDLAAATQEEVNDMWAGLGYYRRARYLLDGAKYIVDTLGGTFPRRAEELKKIPGVGPYTSRAISSQACGEPVAVVDGNVVRVLSRLRRIGGDPKSAQMVKMFGDLADLTLAAERPGDFNQAVMELGATVCVPNTMPACDACPVKAWCRATADGVVMDYPSKAAKAAKREERVGVSVLRAVEDFENAENAEDGGKQGWNDGKFLLLKRPDEGLLAGLWQFPLKSLDGAGVGGSDDGSEGGGDEKRNVAEIMDAYLRNEVGLHIKRTVTRKSLGEHVHVFSHIRMTMVVEELCVVVGDGGLASLSSSDGMHWLTYEELRERSLSSSVKKCLEAYSSHHVDKAKKAKNGIAKFFVSKKKA